MRPLTNTAVSRLSGRSLKWPIWSFQNEVRISDKWPTAPKAPVFAIVADKWPDGAAGGAVFPIIADKWPAPQASAF